MENNELTTDEFNEAFKSIKRNKAVGIDNISGNVVIDVFSEIEVPLFYVFRSSLKNGITPSQLKIAKVTPIFKGGDSDEIGNY